MQGKCKCLGKSTPIKVLNLVCVQCGHVCRCRTPMLCNTGKTQDRVTPHYPRSCSFLTAFVGNAARSRIIFANAVPLTLHHKDYSPSQASNHIASIFGGNLQVCFSGLFHSLWLLSLYIGASRLAPASKSSSAQPAYRDLLLFLCFTLLFHCA